MAMTERQLQEIEAQADGTVPYYVLALIAEVRRLQQENAVLRNGVELQRCVVNAAYEDKCKAEQQRDAALAERDRAHQSALDWKATWEMTQDKEEK